MLCAWANPIAPSRVPLQTPLHQWNGRSGKILRESCGVLCVSVCASMCVCDCVKEREGVCARLCACVCVRVCVCLGLLLLLLSQLTALDAKCCDQGDRLLHCVQHNNRTALHRGIYSTTTQQTWGKWKEEWNVWNIFCSSSTSYSG